MNSRFRGQCRCASHAPEKSAGGIARRSGGTAQYARQAAVETWPCVQWL